MILIVTGSCLFLIILFIVAKKEHEIPEVSDVIAAIFFGGVFGLIATCIGTLILTHNAETIPIKEENYSLIEIEEGIYGYEHKDNDNWIYVYIENENGDLDRISFYKSETEMIYTNKYEPYFYSYKEDYASEALRKLFWKCDCGNEQRVILPFDSIVKENED